MWQVYTPEVGFDRGDELYYMVYTGTNETSAPSKFEFKFLSADAIPVASTTVGTVSEDSKRGVRIALNGSDSDSKYVAFVITQLPRIGKLYMVTGEPIQIPFIAFQARFRSELWVNLLCLLKSTLDAGPYAPATDVRQDRQEC